MWELVFIVMVFFISVGCLSCVILWFYMFRYIRCWLLVGSVGVLGR